jgi:hypothetical protein
MTSYVWFVRGAKHAAMCRTSIESVRLIDKKARCFVMTDERNHAWQLDAGTYYIQTGLPIMLANLEAQVAALFVTNESEPVAFLDSDILLLKPLPSLADLTVTWRDHVLVNDEEKVEGIAAQMPYNYGVIVAEHGHATTEAFIWLRERIRKMHARHQQWYGNQLALAELCGQRPQDGTEFSARPIPWSITSHGIPVNVAKIPCERYNYTPQKVGEDLTDKHVLHFKGGSRPLMESYAKRLGIRWFTEADVKQREAA